MAGGEAMTRTLALPRFLRLPKLAASSRPPLSRSRARRCVLAGLGAILIANVGFAALLDFGPRRLRDPEYGKRISRVTPRCRENPGRPPVYVIGSSRVAMGVRPGAVEPAESGSPLLFNLAMAGSGPVMERLALLRALKDRPKPAAVLLEFWPAFLREDGGYHEAHRIDATRLFPDDLPVIREHFPNPAETERKMLWARANPWFGQRMSLMNQSAGGWLPYSQRTDAMFEKIDAWGWLPGRLGATEKERIGGMKSVGDYYLPLFARYEVSPVADAALRAAVADCRAAGVPVALVYLPESAAFRAFMPPEAQKLADDYLAKVRTELDVPLIDGREWVCDDYLPDGFHLTQDGAAEFTKKLQPAIAATFPNLGGTP